MWWLVSLTGLRRGELAALRWRDIDLDVGTLTVHEQIIVVDGQDVVGFPKSASSRRTIALDKITVDMMRGLWSRHRENLKATGRNREAYVFVDAKGRRLRPDFLTRRLRVLIAECGLPPVRLHDLRHGAASIALAAGVDLKVVQEMLGHASIVTTADIYTKGSGIASDERGSGVLARHLGSVKAVRVLGGCGLTCRFAQRSR